MVPIISGIIAGHGANLTRLKGFALSLAYVLGMALTYTAAGVAFAAAGQQAQTLFQQTLDHHCCLPALFVAMACPCSAFTPCRCRASCRRALPELSNRQRAGSYAGRRGDGCAVGADRHHLRRPGAGCRTVGDQPERPDAARRRRTLRMAIGMGTPLLVVGASAGQLLPRAGAWMDTVKQVFGALMLASPRGCWRASCRSASHCCCWACRWRRWRCILLRAALRSARRALLAARSPSRPAATPCCSPAGLGAARSADPLAPWASGRKPALDLPFVPIKSVGGSRARGRSRRAPHGGR